jgi:hypothetical protein
MSGMCCRSWVTCIGHGWRPECSGSFACCEPVDVFSSIPNGDLT